MNTSVRKEVIDSLGGIQDSLKPIEKSLKEHEMRPFDVEPNYYEDLMMSRNPERFKSNDSQYGDIREAAASTRKEFLKKSMSDKLFASQNGLIVSASPYRAVIRRMDYSSSKIEDNRSDEDEEEGSPNDKIDDEFERDEQDKSNLFASYAKRDFGNPNENVSLVTPIARDGEIIDDSPIGYGLMSDDPTVRVDNPANIYGGLNSSQMT